MRGTGAAAATMLTAEHGQPPARAATGTGSHRLGEQAATLLRSARLRRTQRRITMIAALLEASPQHVRVTELQHRMQTAGWPTGPTAIHRALVSFPDGGLLHTLPAPGPVAHGLSHPAHHHAVCTRCRAVTEIPIADLAPAAVATEATLEPIGFHLALDGVALHGHCCNCLR